MLYLLAGSVNTASTPYWISSLADSKNGTWQDYTTQLKRTRDQVYNEWSAFFKDDWKATPALTFNLGVRYEFYGAPYLRGGYTASIVGQGSGLFGVNRPSATANPFNNWLLAPGNVYLSGYGPNASPSNALQCTNQGAAQNPLLPTPSCRPIPADCLAICGTWIRSSSPAGCTERLAQYCAGDRTRLAAAMVRSRQNHDTGWFRDDLWHWFAFFNRNRKLDRECTRCCHCAEPRVGKLSQSDHQPRASAQRSAGDHSRNAVDEARGRPADLRQNADRDRVRPEFQDSLHPDTGFSITRQVSVTSRWI